MRNNKFHGTGKMTYTDGTSHSGDWFKGKKHGMGTLRTNCGISKIGIWENGKRVSWLDN